RELAAFDEVVWDAAGELSIEQSTRQRLSIEAEPAVLAKIVAEVSGRRLRIGFAPGPIQTRQPIRFRLETRQLAALEQRGSGAVRIAALSTPQFLLALNGSGDIQLGELTARSLEVRLAGSGIIAIDGGQVRDARVSIGGSGQVRVPASERLGASIAGSGMVLYRGRPKITQSITGAGLLRPTDE
ncbi:MAG TPA: DUF2807 domain-containing protein, partial [Burkholderiales bacterium]